MDLLKKLVLLSSLLVLASCNETISPELQQGGVVTPPGGGPTEPTDPEGPQHYFKLTDSSNPTLEYLIHKSGSGNKEAKCEITSQSTPFSKATYKPNHDITCFLEARELALYHSGFSLTVTSSPQACQYVQYRPFSYYNRVPGDSTGNYNVSRCDNYGGPALTLPCNTAVSTTITSPTQFPAPGPDDYSELCRFNHNDQEKCDIGIINVTETTYRSEDDGAGGLNHFSTTETKRIECGGQPRFCVQGPYAKDSNNGKDFTPNGGIRYGTDEKSEFVKTISYEGLQEKNRLGTYVYANYRRNLANYTIAYGEDDDSVPYKQAFAGIKDFHPQLITEYALDGLSFLAYHGQTVPVSEAGRYSAKPLAADPFMGLYSTTHPRYDYTVQPFYAFECLDNSYEVKARIRLVIRDWDRIRSEDVAIADDVELISDIFRIPQGSVVDQDLSGNYYPWSRQDNNDADPDSDIPGRGSFNDFWDWDDIVKMRYLSPMPGSKSYIPSDGFFSTTIFPYEPLEDSH